MPEKTRIVVICGSLRSGSLNRMVINTLPELAPEDLVLEDAPSFAEIPVFNADLLDHEGPPAPVIAIADAVRGADGVLFVSPEYNFSMPGGLKNMLDWVSRLPEQPFFHKPVAIQSVAPGPVGGTRMQYHLRQTMVFLDARVLNKPEIFVTFAADKIDTSRGLLVDETSRGFIANQLKAFKLFIKEWQPPATGQ